MIKKTSGGCEERRKKRKKRNHDMIVEEVQEERRHWSFQVKQKEEIKIFMLHNNKNDKLFVFLYLLSTLFYHKTAVLYESQCVFLNEWKKISAELIDLMILCLQLAWNWYCNLWDWITGILFYKFSVYTSLVCWRMIIVDATWYFCFWLRCFFLLYIMGRVFVTILNILSE